MAKRDARFVVFVVAFDREGRTDGDYNDFRRALDALEADFPGTHLLGTDGTQSWPTYTIREAKP